MATTVKATSYFEALLSNGNVVSMGSLSNPVTVTAGDAFHHQRFSVTTANTQKVFDVADDIASFDFMAIASDQTVEAEFVVADGGNVVVFVKKILANTVYQIASDDSRDSTHTEDWGADGTADTIDKVTIKNSSGATAVVEVFAA